MQQDMMGLNIIITEPSSNLRALGRNALKGKWHTAVIAMIVYMLCMYIPPIILNALFGINMGDVYYNNYAYNDMYYQYSTVYDSMPAYSPLSSLYMLLVTGAFTLGVTLFFLAMFRRQTVGVTDIFLGFERFGKSIGLLLFQSLFIFLWSLLLFVPGIIAAIRYSQAFFILADDPNKGIRECMDESKRMMKGNKGKFFCLSISFIGWAILAAIPAGIFTSIATVLYAPAVVIALVDIIGTLFMAPVMAYMYSTLSGFYEILAGHLIKETEPAPIEPQAMPVSSAAEPAIPEESVRASEDVSATPVEPSKSETGSVNDDVILEEPIENQSKALNIASILDDSEEGNKEEAAAEDTVIPEEAPTETVSDNGQEQK